MFKPPQLITHDRPRRRTGACGETAPRDGRLFAWEPRGEWDDARRAGRHPRGDPEHAHLRRPNAVHDPATVSLAGASVKMVGKSAHYLCHADDVNADGLLDLVCHVLTAQVMIEPGESEAMLEAQTVGGVRIQGKDSARIVPD